VAIDHQAIVQEGRERAMRDIRSARDPLDGDGTALHAGSGHEFGTFPDEMSEDVGENGDPQAADRKRAAQAIIRSRQAG
jgi:hypothetical protein